MDIYVRGLAWYSRFKLIADSKTANYPNFGLKYQFWYSQLQIYQENNPMNSIVCNGGPYSLYFAIYTGTNTLAHMVLSGYVSK